MPEQTYEQKGTITQIHKKTEKNAPFGRREGEPAAKRTLETKASGPALFPLPTKSEYTPRPARNTNVLRVRLKTRTAELFFGDKSFPLRHYGLTPP